MHPRREEEGHASISVSRTGSRGQHQMHALGKEDTRKEGGANGG